VSWLSSLASPTAGNSLDLGEIIEEFSGPAGLAEPESQPSEIFGSPQPLSTPFGVLGFVGMVGAPLDGAMTLPGTNFIPTYDPPPTVGGPVADAGGIAGDGYVYGPQLPGEIRTRIARYAPEWQPGQAAWTDHNDNDPGVTLVQLFAWLEDLLLYRLNKVP